MTDSESNSRCKRIREGKKPLRACVLCRREDCLVWQEVEDLAEKSGTSAPRPPYNGPEVFIEEIQADAKVET